MAADYSRHIFRELERANAEIDNLKQNVIPGLKKEYEARLYDERATAAENNSALRKEKDAEISVLKATISELEARLSAAENEDLSWESVASDERALLRRLEKYKADHLRFATDFCVEFTNNISESDFRFIKNRAKLSGGFRQKSGRKMCCRLMSVIRTCKKRGMNIIDALTKISHSGENAFS